jgi:uncharacterized protein YdeI (YjbR/CyaY-like superfamily)
MLDDKKRIYCEDRESWREWLEKHHKDSNEIWLIYYKAHTGKPRVKYNDAVEEAICFGWIDSIIKKIDEERYMQKFTPRQLKSNWSEPNIRRAENMCKAGKMTDAGLEPYRWFLDNSITLREIKVQIDTRSIPTELEILLKQNKKAKENWDSFSSSVKRRYIGWISSAKKDETRQRRAEEAIKFIEQNVKNMMK